MCLMHQLYYALLMQASQMNQSIVYFKSILTVQVTNESQTVQYRFKAAQGAQCAIVRAALITYFKSTIYRQQKRKKSKENKNQKKTSSH